MISNLPTEPIFDKNGNKKSAIYRKVEPDSPVEEAYDKLGNKLHGLYKKQIMMSQDLNYMIN